MIEMTKFPIDDGEDLILSAQEGNAYAIHKQVGLCTPLYIAGGYFGSDKAALAWFGRVAKTLLEAQFDDEECSRLRGCFCGDCEQQWEAEDSGLMS